jgi:ATP-dependent Clp protease adaptor protein ClpS
MGRGPIYDRRMILPCSAPQGKGQKVKGKKPETELPPAPAFPLLSFPFTLSQTETTPDIDVEQKLKDAFARGWSVIVWNDPINLMDYVVYVFKNVLKMNEQDASRHMWEVHQKGKSIVARETKEKSELLVHRLRAFGLNATLEQA